MGKGGQTVSATSFAELTGVSRERLRTWERRYGFPAPERVGSGPRRYAVTDASRVVAVRRAAEQGVPLRRAIATARATRSPRRPDPHTMAAVPEHLPAPLLLFSGPRPLRVAYANPALAALPRGPKVGALANVTLPWFGGSECEQAVMQLFAGDESSIECSHAGWSDPPAQVRSLLFRLPPVGGAPPLIGMVALERPREREVKQELARARAEREHLDVRLDRHERWLTAIAELAQLFQRESGPALLQATAETLVRRLPPLDAGVAVYMAGELALGSTSRGMLGPRMVTVTAHPDLAELLRERVPAWLTPASAAAFGAPDSVHVLAIPVTVVAETLGALLMVTDEPSDIDEELTQLFSVLSASIGFALLRDRLVESTRDAAR